MLVAQKNFWTTIIANGSRKTERRKHHEERKQGIYLPELREEAYFGTCLYGFCSVRDSPSRSMAAQTPDGRTSIITVFVSLTPLIKLIRRLFRVFLFSYCSICYITQLSIFPGALRAILELNILTWEFRVIKK